VVSGRGLYVGLITRPTECGVPGDDHETLIMRKSLARWGGGGEVLLRHDKNKDLVAGDCEHHNAGVHNFSSNLDSTSQP